MATATGPTRKKVTLPAVVNTADVFDYSPDLQNMATRGDEFKMHSPHRVFFELKQPSGSTQFVDNKSLTGNIPESGNQTRQGSSTTPSTANSSASGDKKRTRTKPKVPLPLTNNLSNKEAVVQCQPSRVKSQKVLTPGNKDRVRTGKQSSPNSEATKAKQTVDRQKVIPTVTAKPRQMTEFTPIGGGTLHTGEQPGDQAKQFQLGTETGAISKGAKKVVEARATSSTTKASLPAATATASLEVSLPDTPSGIDVIQNLLDTQKELAQAYELVDQLLQEIKKLQIAATEFYEYAQLEFAEKLQLQNTVTELYEYAHRRFRAGMKLGERKHSEQKPSLSMLQEILCNFSEGNFPSPPNPTWIPAMQELAVELAVDFLQKMGTSMVRKVLKLHDTENPTDNTLACEMSSSEFIDTLVSDKVRFNVNRHADSTKHDLRQTSLQSAPSPSSYQTAVCYLSRKTRKGVKAIAALDPDANQNLVDRDTAVRLGLKRTSKTHAMKVKMFNQHFDIDSYRVELVLTSTDRLSSITITACAVQDLAKHVDVIDWSKEKHKFSHLKKVPFETLPSERSINLLIGYDHAGLFKPSEMRAGTPGQPIARLTPLGWTCSVTPDEI